MVSDSRMNARRQATAAPAVRNAAIAMKCRFTNPFALSLSKSQGNNYS